jgi:hypothetical protein
MKPGLLEVRGYLKVSGLLEVRGWTGLRMENSMRIV